MAFNLFKKKEDSPPDVGKEEVVADAEDAVTDIPIDKSDDSDNSDGSDNSDAGDNKKTAKQIKNNKPDKKDRDAKKPVSENNNKNNTYNSDEENNFSVDIEGNKLEFEKIKAKLEAMDAFMKGFNERFSNISQQIGELRAMNLSNEKSISKATQEAMKTVDIVREVKPDKLRLDYQRLDMKFQEFSEKLEINKQFTETIMNEIKDLRRKAGIFVGTDALLKLNEEVKKDLVEIQKTESRVKMNADKSEEIFVELKKGFAENEKVNEIVDTLDSNYSGMKKDFEKLKLDFSSIVTQDDFNDFKKKMDVKLSFFETASAGIEKQKEENERLGRVIETILALSKKNEENIADIGINIGDDKLKRVSDYEEELASLLRIIDTLAGEIADIKKKIGIDDGKITVEKSNKEVIGKDELKMKNLEVHPQVSKPLISKKEDVSDDVEKMHKKINDSLSEGVKTFRKLEEIRKNNKDLLGVFKNKKNADNTKNNKDVKKKK